MSIMYLFQFVKNFSNYYGSYNPLMYKKGTGSGILVSIGFVTFWVQKPKKSYFINDTVTEFMKLIKSPRTKNRAFFKGYTLRPTKKVSRHASQR